MGQEIVEHRGALAEGVDQLRCIMGSGWVSGHIMGDDDVNRGARG